MNALIVEDDPYKLSELKAFLVDAVPGASVAAARSINSAKAHIRNGGIELLLLDMSLPSYDIGASEPGGRPHAFGGREILGYIDFLELALHVVVVTQFERLGSGVDEVDIQTLGASLKEAYPRQFCEIVYFNAASEQWKNDLREAIRKIGTVPR
ncbi:response regulator [Myxococcus xanthus]|uniref:response regulator n=1 Tax=Myxococcus xanthus TaxID=34 RepID=UPI0011287735|nr:response regulator [Myxococcus xanthus]QDE84143.1 hypothetical protein BHS07_22725 [Myxococcus xanthus]